MHVLLACLAVGHSDSIDRTYFSHSRTSRYVHTCVVPKLRDHMVGVSCAQDTVPVCVFAIMNSFLWTAIAASCLLLQNVESSRVVRGMSQASLRNGLTVTCTILSFPEVEPRTLEDQA